jgi:hypothetical protein
MNNAMKMYSGMPQVLCEECCKHRVVASHPGIALSILPQPMCVWQHIGTTSADFTLVTLSNKPNFDEIAKNIVKKKIARPQFAGSKTCAFAHFSV